MAYPDYGSITIRGARENNLKNVSLDIPKRRITVFTGVSGSGKSSLVFSTIAAESQRLINETYPAFVQQFMPHYGQPDADVLENISAAIIVDQPKAGRQFALDRSDGDRHELRLSQPSVSKHLRLLREAGFVVQRIEAQRRLSRLRPEPIIELDAWLVPFRRFWSKHVDALEQHLNKMETVSPKAPLTAGRKKA